MGPNNLIEIVKTKSDLMNRIRNMLKAYEVEWENSEIASIVDNEIDDINHVLNKALGDKVREIVEQHIEDNKQGKEEKNNGEKKESN